MATYVMTGRYTLEGAKGITAERSDKSMALVKKLGGEIKSAYALLGKDDVLIIADFPNTEAAMKASLALSKLTGIGFSTAPALDMATFDKLAKDT